ncbi:MAG: glycosyltransferase family 4 protein [Candidatus Krumholzibacteria bacterium]|nr:glycosyltransferase family 4 protein [Candidatus Krumholzibacteria bacterium]MDP7022177.1 glycosyltransferase family 4 protein [Candidatus Krumholzibacteria bacterium]
MILHALVEEARRCGHVQRTVFGWPEGDPLCKVGGMSEGLSPVSFETSPLDFPIPGMSDVMPYSSSVWSRLDEQQLERYRKVFHEHIARQVEDFQPDIIHSHHLWLMSSLLRALAPDTPIILHCHATGLRQRELCPSLAEEVALGCRLADHILVPLEDHMARVSRDLDFPMEKISLLRPGLREDLFHLNKRRAKHGRLLYAGKLSKSKGLPQLLDAMRQLPDAHLVVAGSGSGEEAAELKVRMEQMPQVHWRGPLTQGELADEMREAEVFVLPSFYEGLPLVLLEAAACGCRIVSTALEGVRKTLAPVLGSKLELVEPPAMCGIDTPETDALPAFTRRLEDSIRSSLGAESTDPPDLSSWSWPSVFARVERTWELERKKNRFP